MRGEVERQGVMLSVAARASRQRARLAGRAKLVPDDPTNDPISAPGLFVATLQPIP